MPPTYPKVAYKLSEAAELASVPSTTLQEAKTAGEISVCIIGGGQERERWVILHDDLLMWLSRKRRAAKEDG